MEVGIGGKGRASSQVDSWQARGMDGPPKTSNEAKFETRNPVVQRMIARFFSALGEVVEPLSPSSTLDAGCGEGETLARLGPSLGASVTAIDVEQSCVDRVRARLPEVEARRGSVTALPFDAAAFDLVLCLEVLEHVPDPGRAIRELARVCRGDLVVSVPYEPWFRLGSLLRGNYVSGLGNHPEHVNHFGRRSLAALVASVAEPVQVRVAFPWLIASCRVPG